MNNPLMTTAEADAIARERRIQAEIALSTQTLNNRPPPFQPAPLPDVARRAIGRFAERGVRLSAGADGSLLVSPAGQIDSQEREFLVRHKAEIIQYLNSYEVI